MNFLCELFLICFQHNEVNDPLCRTWCTIRKGLTIIQSATMNHAQCINCLAVNNLVSIGKSSSQISNFPYQYSFISAETTVNVFSHAKCTRFTTLAVELAASS